MITKKTEYILLAVIMLIAIVTRFYKLGYAPAGLYLDEAAQGYSAYSILKTGKDEFGKQFPIVFRSFTDFKPPTYTYLIVPFIQMFDLTKFAVRFPSFVFSILTIPALYLLIKKVSPKHLSQPLSLVSCLLLAISPWHILFGRTDYECTIALFFLTSAIYFFYITLEKPKVLALSAIFFALAITTYHAQRIITPVILLILFLRYKRVLLSKGYLKNVILGLASGFIILIPTLSVAFTPGFLARANGLNIISHVRQLPAGYLSQYSGILNSWLNGSWFLTTREFFALYVSYFSPRNLFVLGDSGPRSSYPALATFFLWQFPLLLGGLYLFFKDKALGELRFLVISLLLIAPIPAALTRDPYSTIRSLQMVIPLGIIVSYGIIVFYGYAKDVFLKFPRANLVGFNILLSLAGFTILGYSLLKLYSSVIILNEYYRASEWNYGLEEVAQTIKTLDSKVPIVVDNARNEAYIQLLFFLKYDPEKYQQDNFEVPLSEYYTNMNRNYTKTIGNITTRPINWKEDLSKEQYLIGDSLAISDEQIQKNNLTLIKKVYYPDTSPAFIMVKTNSHAGSYFPEKI